MVAFACVCSGGAVYGKVLAFFYGDPAACVAVCFKYYFRCLDALCDDGYIQYEYRATGFCGIKLTPKGIHFVENGFQDDTVPSISGNNNIFVTGSGNTISNNYNQLIADVQNSELDPEIKEVLETLLYELKNPALSEKKKESKIKDFLSEISSDALSDTASSTLSTLLMFLFKKIIF